MKLHTFSGGIRFTADHDQLSSKALAKPIKAMPIPSRLVFPLQARSGHIRHAVVSVGDHVRSGQVLAVADNGMDVPLLASCDGMVDSVTGGIIVTTTPEQTVDRNSRPIDENANGPQKLHALAIQGLGGAAFPGSAKLESAGGEPIDTLIINAAECEPLICCDQGLIREHAADIVTGIKQLVTLTSAGQCLIGIEDSMETEIRLLQDALGANGTDDIQLVPIPTIYPTGSEKQLIRVLTGHEIAATQLPRDQRILCFNIATAYSVKQALIDQQPQLERIVTVTGTAVKDPCNVQVKFGTPLSELLAWLDVTLAPGTTVIMGGPMTGQQVDASSTAISAASNCLVLDRPTRQLPALPCIRCGDCDKVCPAGLLPQQLHWFCNNANLDDAEKFHLSSCIECGCCDYVCPSKIELTPQFRQAKQDVQESARQTLLAGKAKLRHQARTDRLERKAQLREQRIQQRKAALEKKRARPAPGARG